MTDQVTLDREFDADPDDVWEALTTDEGFSSWSGAGSAIDPRPGGPVSTPDDATGRERIGAVESVEDGRRLRYRWWPVDDPDAVSTVDIEITPLSPGTRVTIVEKLALPMGAPQCSATGTAPWTRRTARLAASWIRL